MTKIKIPTPILYTFRRCPYAMRARLSIQSSGQALELREIILRDKPPPMLEASPKGTVPVLILEDGTVLDESLDIMLFVLGKSDPEKLLSPQQAGMEDMLALISENDNAFKANLDRYKYPNRYDAVDPIQQRDQGAQFLMRLDQMLEEGSGFLFRQRYCLADLAILPFVRQFANVDKNWFDDQNWPHLKAALDTFVTSERFLSIMIKFPQWKEGDPPTYFGGGSAQSGNCY